MLGVAPAESWEGPKLESHIGANGCAPRSDQAQPISLAETNLEGCADAPTENVSSCPTPMASGPRELSGPGAPGARGPDCLDAPIAKVAPTPPTCDAASSMEAPRPPSPAPSSLGTSDESVVGARVYVGDDFQATLPPVGAAASEDTSELVWSPTCLQGDGLDDYLRRARLSLKEPRLSHQWEETALATLQEQGGVVESALAMLPLEEDLAKADLWGDEEHEALLSALRSNSNDLLRLHAKLQTERSLGAVVEQAYLCRPSVSSKLDDADFGEMPLAVMRPRRTTTWDCDRCTFTNERRYKICQMCRMGRRPAPGAEAAGSAAGEANGVHGRASTARAGGSGAPP